MYPPLLFLLPAIGILLVSRALFHMFRSVLRDTPAGQIDRVPRTSLIPRGVKSTESRVFALAYRLGGRVTLSDVVMETGMGMEESETVMNHMDDELHVRMIVDDKGLVIYEFPEVIDRLERESR